MNAWLLLTFFMCLHNLLISKRSVITHTLRAQKFEKCNSGQKNTFVSGNASDEKNIYPGGCNFLKLIFQRYSLSLVWFPFFVFVFFFLPVCFLKLEIYILIHIARLCEWVSGKKYFSPSRFPETRLLFFGFIKEKVKMDGCSF